MQRVDNKAGKAVIKERMQEIEWVVTGSLKSYFYVGQITGQRTDLLIELIEALPIVWKGKRREQDLTIRTKDAAVMFVLGDINTDIDH